MKKIGNTNVKTYSKVSEFESADTVQIVEDILDYNRGESVKNGVVVSRQRGSRRIVDRNRNNNAHTEIDYSQFKVTKLEQGQTVDNSKREKQLENAALSLLADLGIDWSEDEEIEDDSEQEETEPQTNSEPETVESEQVEMIEPQSDKIENKIPAIAVAIFAEYFDTDTDNISDHYIGEFDDINDFANYYLEQSKDAEVIVDLWGIDGLIDTIEQQTIIKRGHVFRRYASDLNDI